MFTTVKEVHVYIDGAIQVLMSNRKHSIAPPLLDMFLNNAVVEYISSRFPNGYNAKDIESTLKRYTDFSVLKSTFKSTPYLTTTSLIPTASCPKPYNAIKIQDAVCSYTRPFSSSDKAIAFKSKLDIKIKDELVNQSSATINMTLISSNSVKTIVINLDNVLAEIKSTDGSFYLYNYLIDVLSNIYKLNVKYDSTSEFGTKLISIEPPIGFTFTSATSTAQSYIQFGINSEQVSISSKVSGSFAVCSIHQNGDALRATKDFYSFKNSHLDPIAEINESTFDIYYKDFLPNMVAINYIRRPKLFNIYTGQVPEIVITKDFLDFAVKNISLVMSSPANNA